MTVDPLPRERPRRASFAPTRTDEGGGPASRPRLDVAAEVVGQAGGLVGREPSRWTSRVHLAMPSDPGREECLRWARTACRRLLTAPRLPLSRQPDSDQDLLRPGPTCPGTALGSRSGRDPALPSRRRPLGLRVEPWSIVLNDVPASLPIGPRTRTRRGCRSSPRCSRPSGRRRARTVLSHAHVLDRPDRLAMRPASRSATWETWSPPSRELLHGDRRQFGCLRDVHLVGGGQRQCARQATIEDVRGREASASLPSSVIACAPRSPVLRVGPGLHRRITQRGEAREVARSQLSPPTSPAVEVREPGHGARPRRR